LLPSRSLKHLAGHKIKDSGQGDHHIFSKADITEIMNLQPLKDGKTKAYQVKQVRSIIIKYKLHKEVEDV